MLVMLMHLKNSNIVEGKAKLGFAMGFSMIIITAFCEWMSLITNNSMLVPVWAHALVNSMEFALSPTIVVMWTYGIGNIQRVKILFPFLVANTIVEFASAKYGFIFYINEHNEYCRGDFYLIYILFYCIAILFMFQEAYLFSRKYQNRNRETLIASFIFLLFGIGANMLNSDMHSVWISVAICSVLFYIYYIELAIQMDSLTALLNRRSYDMHIKQLNYPTAIIMLDIDKFKSINDTYGHAYGDLILQQISSCIRKAFNGYGLCYRIGGDEFCVILREGKLDSRQSVINILQKRFDTIMAEARRKSPLLPTVSLGFEIFDGSKSITKALRHADLNMYDIKRNKEE